MKFDAFACHFNPHTYTSRMKKSTSLINRAAKALIIIVAHISLSTSAAAQTLIISPSPDIDPQLKCLLTKTYDKIFSSMGYEIKFPKIPLPRASVMANEGFIDGELSRNDGYSLQWDNLIQISEPHGSTSFALYSIDLLTLDNIQKISKGSTSIGFKRGSYRIKDFLTPIKENRVLKVNSHLSGLNMLMLGRLGIYIGLEGECDKIIKQNFPSDIIKKINRINATTTHLVISKKHKHLEKEISKQLLILKSKNILLDLHKSCESKISK